MLCTYEEQQSKGEMSLPEAAEMDVILPNSVTVYQSSNQATVQLSRLVTEYDSI